MLCVKKQVSTRIEIRDMMQVKGVSNPKFRADQGEGASIT